jgi:hypothetical protein
MDLHCPIAPHVRQTIQFPMPAPYPRVREDFFWFRKDLSPMRRRNPRRGAKLANSSVAHPIRNCGG